MTFVTTYALILPAITVEKENTDKVAGMYLEQEGTQDDLLEENALEFTGVSIAADQENAVTYEYADDDMTAVAVFSTEEEIPEGVELVVNPVDTESEKYTEFSNRAALLLDSEFIYDVTTCSFYDFALICDGVDVTPKTGLVDVQINFLNNTVSHAEDVVYAGRFGRAAEAEDSFVAMAADITGETADTLAGSAEDELVSANPDESSVVELTNGIITVLSLKGNDLAQNDSILGILAGYVDEEAKAAAAETNAEIPDINDSQDENLLYDPAETGVEDAPAVGILKVAGKDYTVNLTYDESSGIPEGAVLDVSEIAQDSKEYETYLAEAKKAMGLKEEETLPKYAARFFDIKILVGGKEFTPESGVSVEIAYTEPLALKAETEVNAVHFEDDASKAEVIEANTTEVQVNGIATVEFTAESFSVYGVIYTVDFHWEADGKSYDFSLPGGGFMSFTKLMQILGVAGEESEGSSYNTDSGEMTDSETAQSSFVVRTQAVAVSEETKNFVANVDSVKFSSPGLLSVSKVNENTTVGNIKDELGLECEYSDELTEEDIAGINAEEVEGGDWALISLKPFDTEETLTVTMKNGDVFVVRVTDDRIGNELNGMKYMIVSQDNLVMTADSSSVGNGYLSANPATGNGNQMWVFEYDGRYEDTYRIKSETEGKYIVLDNNSNISFTDSEQDCTLFWIDEQDGTYQFYTMQPPAYNWRIYLNTNNSDGTTRYRMGSDSSQRFTLQEAKTINKKGDWLLFQDEEQDDIYIHVGDTITLRPYDKWTWKKEDEDIRNVHWRFYTNAENADNNIQDSAAPLDSDWVIPAGAANESGSSSGRNTWTTTGGVFEFKRHIKYDDQLETRYWSVQGEAKKTGTYVLTNTANNHKITVHVLPADDQSHQLGTFTGTDRIKVNLFDYDRIPSLDPLNNGNANGSYEQAINIYRNQYNGWSFHDLRFSSSGGGSGINRYTRDDANPGIVDPKLGDDNFPVLAGGSKESLAYLFDTSKTTWSGGKSNDAIIAYPELTGLFQQDNAGYYYYNSNSNYAYYTPIDPDDPTAVNKQITLYEHTYTQTRTLERTVNGQLEHYSGLFNSKPIGFFPFHDYDSQNDLWVNQNHNLNHHLGMSMEVKFALPSGKVTKDGKPITFEFTGDDDIWVFVDDDLSLDMGGIHQPIYGKIDFTNDDRFEAGREYTLRVFYLERGGCDSNCAIRFNMPLTIGTADVNVVKHDKEGKTPLPGAEFAIWEKEDCEGEPLRRETSGPDGIIHFESLPIFEVGQVYYMKETKAPGSHFLDSTVYKLTAERIGQTDNFRFVITVNKPGADPLATTDGNDPLPIIDNTRAEPIDLTIHKEWQNTDGTEHVPDGASATFKIKRWMTYNLNNEEHAYKVNLINASNNQVLSNGSRWAFAGDTLDISYTHGYDPSPWNYIPKTRTGDDALTMNTSQGNHTVQYSVNKNHANADTRTIDILISYNDFLRWCNPVPYFTSGSTTEPAPRITQGDSVHILDREYNESTTEGIVTLPYDNDWTRVIENLPTTEERVIEGKTYTCYYDYFIVETEASPSGYETIYIDGHNNIIPSSKVQDIAGHEDGSQTIINRKLINVPVEKRWPDYEHEGYTWEAVLHMDFREVPLDGSAPTVWAPYHEGEDDEDDYIITLGNTEGHSLSGQFRNLPMYVTRNDGKVCRREYSVIEQSYIVWETVPTSVDPTGKRVVASFDGTTYYPDENHKYALWYQHDAGEDNNYGDSNYPGEEDYNIMVYNMHENRTTKKDIGLTINKIWKDADGQVISEIPDNYKTKFVLKRNVIVEYRNYENETTPRDQWVWVKLVAGEHEQMLQVPPGRQMYIRGNLIKGRDPGLIVFRDSNNAEFVAIMDDDPGFDAYNLFKASFNAPTEGYTSESDPFVVTCIAGDRHAVGGDDGFLLSDSSDRQIIGLDSTFSKEFELSNENDWTKVFPKTGSGEVSDDPQEQFENEHPLPAIEVSTLDESGNTANTYIYTYFFEEVSCTPDSFYATYTDSGNNIIGDISQPIHSDETITATNRPIIFNILKIDKDDNNKKLPGAEFEFRKLAGNPPTAAAGGTFGTDASFGTLELPSTDTNGVITISGNPEGSGLKPGYYEVKETKPPIGHILSKDVVIYLKVEENGDIKLMEKANADGGIVLVDGGNTTADGYVTLSSASGINGRTITFKVENEPGAELPHTGGPGTMLIYLLGSMLTLAAGLLLMRRRTI